MTLAANMSEYYWYIAVAIGGVLHWLSERNKKKAEAEQPQEPPQQQPSSPPPQPAGASSEQERLRKFMEALGIPQGQQPPQRPVQPPPPAPRPVVAIPKPRPIVRVPVPRPLVVPEMEMASHETHEPGSHPLEQQAPAPSPSDAGKITSQSRNILELLQSPRDLRAMLLAREILGPPPGLQR